MNEITSAELTQKLCENYYNILKNLDISYLDKNHPARSKELSGIFLASIPENYHHAKNKIMIIGRETKGWGSFDQKSKKYSFTDLQDFIQKSVTDHQCFFKKQLLLKTYYMKIIVYFLLSTTTLQVKILYILQYLVNTTA